MKRRRRGGYNSKRKRSFQKRSKRNSKKTTYRLSRGGLRL